MYVIVGLHTNTHKCALTRTYIGKVLFLIQVVGLKLNEMYSLCQDPIFYRMSIFEEINHRLKFWLDLHVKFGL